jgi:hypothetical protein
MTHSRHLAAPPIRRAGVSSAPELAHGVTRGREVVLHAGFSDGTALVLRTPTPGDNRPRRKRFDGFAGPCHSGEPWGTSSC